MGDADYHRFIRLVIEAAYEVQCLVWMLGMAEGTVSLSIHKGDDPPLKLDVTRWEDATPRPSPEFPLKTADDQRLKSRSEFAQLRDKIVASLHNMAGQTVICLAGRPMGLEFGSINFTVHRGMVRDFVVARRVILSHLEGFDSLFLAG
jgi:hypothetical protein